MAHKHILDKATFTVDPTTTEVNTMAEHALVKSLDCIAYPFFGTCIYMVADLRGGEMFYYQHSQFEQAIDKYNAIG